MGGQLTDYNRSFQDGYSGYLTPRSGFGSGLLCGALTWPLALSAVFDTEFEHVRRGRLLAVLRLGDFVVGRGKHIADDLAIIRLVLDHQNALAHAASTCRSTTTGSVKVKVEPWPGS